MSSSDSSFDIRHSTFPPVFHLIDLARVFRPSEFRRMRWIVKDLAQLRYSLGEMITAEEWNEFLGRYEGTGAKSPTLVSADAIAGKVRQIARHAGKQPSPDSAKPPPSPPRIDALDPRDTI